MSIQETLENFYIETEELAKAVSTTTINKYGRKQYIPSKTQSNLNIVFDYYYHNDTGIVVGLAELLPNHKFKYLDFIDIYTGISLPRTKRAYYATKQVIRGRGVYVGQYKPLDFEFLEFIKDRQQRIIRNNKCKDVIYD